MKNVKRILALVLCLLLVFPAALAEEVVKIIGGPDVEGYIVGEPSGEVFMDALMAGKLVGGEIEMDLALNAQTLGIPAEEAELVQAVLDVVAQSKLAFGAGLTGEGLRIALGAQLADAAGENPVSVEALADVTIDGVSVECDLIPGKRVSVRWETLLEMAGMSAADIELLMSLKEMDPQEVMAAIEEAMAQLEPMIEMAVQLATPYAETVMGFVLGLPMEVQENLNEEGYPPTATELCVTVTEKDLGALITLLCDQFEQDNTLMVFANALLQEADAGVTAAEVIAEVRASAAEMTNTDTPVSFYLGMNEDGVPMYGEVYIVNEPTGESIYGGLFLYQDADGVWQFELLGGLYDKESTPIVAAGMNISYAGDPADANVYAALFEMYAVEGENPLMEIVMTMDNAKAEGELPAYDTNVAMSMYIADGEVGVQAVSSAVGSQGLTAAGGEYSNATATTDVYVGDMVQTQTETVEQVIEPTADGGVTGYTKVVETMPASGVDKLEMLITYTSEDIDMAASKALEQVAVEQATDEQLTTLLMEVINAASEKLPALMNNVPAPLLEAVMAEMGE